MKINGEDRKFDRPMTVAEMLEAEGYKRTAVAVEVNLEIVPKTAYDTRVLHGWRLSRTPMTNESFFNR